MWRCGMKYAYLETNHVSTSMWVVMDSIELLCMTIPTIKRCDLCSYEEPITCKSYSYGDLKFSHPQLQLQIYLRLDLHEESGSLLITTENTTQALICLLPFQIKIFILTSESFRPVPHRCSWPERCSFFFVFLAGSIWSVYSSVTKSPHHNRNKPSEVSII